MRFAAGNWFQLISAVGNSVSHRIKHDVDAHRVGLLLGKFVEIIFAFAFPFPAIAQVSVVAKDHHQSIFVVEYSFDMNFLPVFALPSDAGPLACNAEHHVRDLRLLFEVKHTMKNWMVQGELDWFPIWKHALDLLVANIPFALAPEVVKHKKSAIQKVFAKDLHFLIRKEEPARFHNINKRIIHEPFVRKPEMDRIWIDLDGGHLLQPIGKI